MQNGMTAIPGVTRYGRDADLLADISVRAADPAEGEAAIREFMQRWQGNVQVITREVCLAFPASYIGREDLEQALWVRICERAGDFTPAADLGEKQEPRIYGWMRTMARNLLTDLYREHIKLPLFALLNEEPETRDGERIPIFSDAKPGSAQAVSERAVLANLSAERQADIAILRSLTPAEQEVLRRVAPFIDEEQGVIIPKELKQGILDDLKTTDDRFRQTLSRAMKKARERKRQKRSANHGGPP
jgi:DNA-directed RNA polymerase specialized sigma24 family protein